MASPFVNALGFWLCFIDFKVHGTRVIELDFLGVDRLVKSTCKS